MAFVDLEMSGLDHTRDRVLQICIERYDGGEPAGRLLSYVRPEPPLSTITNSAIHGITVEQLSDAPSMAALADRIVELLHGSILVAHAARYDVAFLGAELSRIGRLWSCPHYLDSLALSRRTLRLGSHRLDALARALNIDMPFAHRADGDVRVLRGVFAHLLSKLRPGSARDLWQLAAKPRSVRPDILAAALLAAEHGHAVRLSYRPCGRRPQELTCHITAVRTDLDPPVVLGYLQHTRGRREFRADRILTLEPAGHDSVEVKQD